MTSSASPSGPSEAVGRVLRGNRKMRIDSKVKLSENGMEDLEDFFDKAKTPAPANKPKKRQPLKQDNRKAPSKAATTKRFAPRFSIDGNNNNAEDEAGSVSEFRSKLQRGAISPGELSRVSTAPPTPKEMTPEATRAAQPEEVEVTLTVAAQHKSPGGASVMETSMNMSPAQPEVDDFPMDDDEEEDDDLLPPPPPEDDMELEPSQVEPDDAVEFPTDIDHEETKSVSSKKSSTKVEPFQDEASVISRVSVRRKTTENVVQVEVDDDDDDKEGPGFNMSSPPAASQESTITETTPEPKKKRGRPKKRKSEGSQKTPAPRNKGKKREKTLFSPAGYPVGPREMKPVPVSDYKETPPKGVRRSNRMQVGPLAFWKNERPLYGPHDEDGELGEEMGCMPVVKSVLVAEATPRKQRKAVVFAAESKRQRRSVEEDEKPFNSSKLRKKFKVMDSESALIWDEENEEATSMKVVSYVAELTATDLPLSRPRKKNESKKPIGRAAQSFNISSSKSDAIVGYIMGNLVLPPGGLKDSESTGSCSQVFTVCNCQPKSVEVAYGDPNEEEGSLTPLTAQRFLLSAGDQFRIPPGNAYQLTNHSTTTDCLFAWTIIRPRRTEEDSP